MARKNGAGGRIIEVNASGQRSPARAVKPSEKVYVRLPEEQPPELFSFEDEGEATYVDAALQGVMADLGASDEDAKVTVYRLISAQGVRRQEWLFECHPKEFSIPQLQADFGAGEYRVRLYGQQQGSNYKVVHADKRLTIGAGRGHPKADAPALPGAPQAHGADELTRAISQAISAPLMALAQAFTQAMPKQRDTLADFRQFAEVMATMRGHEAPNADPITALERAVALLASAKASAPMVGEDGEVSTNAILAQGISMVKEFFAAARERSAAAPVPALAAPGAPVAVARPIQPQPNPTNEGDSMNFVLKMQLKMALTAAQNNSDPALYAGLIYEQAPDEFLAALAAPDWWEQLTKMEPGFAATREWCDKVRALVVDEMNAPPEPEELTPPAPESITGGNAAVPSK